jgi:hypothetical protein
LPSIFQCYNSWNGSNHIEKSWEINRFPALIVVFLLNYSSLLLISLCICIYKHLAVFICE